MRTVVNTHFHFDHLHGNQIYPSHVEIIAHEFTREAVVSGASTRGRGYDSFVRAVPDQIAAMEKQLASTDDEAKRDELIERLEITRAFRRSHPGGASHAPHGHALEAADALPWRA